MRLENIRIDYKSIAKIIQALKSGNLHEYCTYASIRMQQLSWCFRCEKHIIIIGELRNLNYHTDFSTSLTTSYLTASALKLELPFSVSSLHASKCKA